MKIQITKVVVADGYKFWPGMKLRVAIVDKRSDGTPLAFTIDAGNVIPATHAVLLTVENMRHVTVGHADRPSREQIKRNLATH